MPTLFPTPDKKLFSDLLELAGDFHTLERAFARARTPSAEPPSLEALVRAIQEIKRESSPATELIGERPIPHSVNG